MRVKAACSMMLVVTGMFLSVAVQAQDAPAGDAAAEGAPPASPASEASPAPAATATSTGTTIQTSKMRVAINVVPMPFLGKLTATVGEGPDLTSDTAFAIGIMPVFDYIAPDFFVGLAPMYTFNVKAKGSSDAAKEIDIMLRFGGGAPVTDQLQLYAYLSPGYSLIQPPSGNSAKGFSAGGHVGGMYDLTSAAFVDLEVGYQVGLQKLNGADLQTSFLQIGLGAGIHI